MDPNLPRNPLSPITTPIVATVAAMPSPVTSAPMPTGPNFEKKIFFASLSLRLGLGFVFLFAAFSGFLHPQNYIHFIPELPIHIMSKEMMLQFFEIYELALVAWLLSGKFLLYGAILSALTISFLTAVNLGDFNILFRNIAIIFGAVALAILSWKPKAH